MRIYNLRKSMGRLVESDRESQITFDTDITFLSSDKHSNGKVHMLIYITTYLVAVILVHLILVSLSQISLHPKHDSCKMVPTG